ncbi:putative sodium-coupled neutral amino acid transporter 11 isoform X3 [Monodelphis domestica]|uniref:putative sodium-coupled neutral amino acid transporter 11 isoform X3 n=1 Tax=Monodelphis domestica TaxID=13616 RepID=UPI000443346B|nr:putative sodium-coupled neutral amino acid transporter 11 isoform X3 [Monodelphis domestica]
MGDWLQKEAAAGALAEADPGILASDGYASLSSMMNMVTSLPMGYQGQRLCSSPKRDFDDKEALVSEHKLKEKGNFRQSSAIFNVVNSITGSGIIGLPYSINQAGLPLGILLLFWVAYVTDFSLILLIKGGVLSGTHSYQALVHKTFGFPGYLLLSLLQFLYPFIAMISYNIITGDTLSKVFQRIPGVDPGNFFIGRHFIIGLSTVAFSLPLSLFRDIAKLGKASLISAVLTAMILIFVIIRAFTLGPYITRTEDAWVFAKPNTVQAVGVMSFGDLFENYCRNDSLINFGRFCYGITVILTYPIECFVTREVIANVFFGGNLSKISHVIVTTVIITMATLVSLMVDCLGIVLEFNGVLCAAPLIFIIPSACYLKLSEERWIHPDKIMSSVMLLNGVVVMVVGFVMTILYPQDCSHGQEMAYCSFTNASFFNISFSSLDPTIQSSVLNISTFQ